MTETAPQQPSIPESQQPQSYAEPKSLQANGQAAPQGYARDSYMQPVPGQYYPQAPPRGDNGFGVAGLVLGIIGLVFSWIPGLNLVLGVLATVFGALGWRKANRGGATNGGSALAGMIMGIITLAAAVGLAIAVGLSIPG